MKQFILSTLATLLLPIPALGGIDQVAPMAIRPLGTPMSSPGTFHSVYSLRQRIDDAKPIFTPDWKCGISSPEEFEWFTVIDANGDANTDRGTWFWRSDVPCAWYNYSYSAYGEDVDDWLVSPGFNLKGGKTYTLSFYTTNRSSFYDDQMEVCIGASNTVEAMNTELIPRFSISSDDWVLHTVEFTVENSGIWYVGFHLMEAAYMSSIFIDEISITGETLEKSPSAIKDLTITPDPKGCPNATLTFKLPDECADGSVLEGLSGVRIRNGYFEIADIQDVKPGELITYEANLEKADTYTFNIAAYNDVDEGVNTSHTIFVGLDIPATPQNVVLHDNVSKMTLTADPITSAHGGVFFPEDVTFSVYEIARDEYGFPAVGNLIASAMGTMEIDLPVSTVDGPQSIISYVTNASNQAGPSPNYYQTNNVILGKPYETPFLETFDNGQTPYFWITQIKQNGFGTTGIYSSEIESYSNHPGCIILSAVSKDDIAGFYSGKITLTEDSEAKLSFALRNASQTDGTINVYVLTADGEDHVIDTMNVADIPSEWTVYTYDLSQFATQRYINAGVQYKAAARDNSNQIYLDNVFVGSLPPYDIKAELSAVRMAERGSEMMLHARIGNAGAQTVRSLSITLNANDKTIDEFNIDCELNMMESITVDIPVKIAAIETASSMGFRIDVSIDGDAFPEDNTAYAYVTLKDPDLAAPESLVVSEEEDSVTINWEKVSHLAPYTENFDSYEPWNYLDDWGWVEHNVGDWTMVDVDLGSTGGFTDALYYGSQGQKFAYTVFNPYNYTGYGTSLFTVISEEAGASFIPHSDEQYLAAIYSADTYWEDGQYFGVIKDADNWTISPEQTGEAQTIRFWVNNYKGLSGNGYVIDHVETYEVLVSYGGMNPEDFIAIGGQRHAAGGEWQQVEVDLPEGTKYFAIRHCSPYNMEMGTPFIFMVDDITYSVPNKPMASYNIYRDGILLGSVDKDTTSYTDHTSVEANILYQVTAVYEDGSESGAASAFTYGVNGINAPMLKDTFDIFTPTGVAVRRNATDFYGLPSGIYITSDGRRVHL